MSMADQLRKGFTFFLMSMGVSTYARKPKPQEAPAIPPAKPE
ncbi:hypothetical protein [Acidicapsa ligni]|nr:hypothetical protein [Acidicapsa ligni]